MLRVLWKDLVNPQSLMFKITCIFFIVSLTTTITLSLFFYRNTSGIIRDNNDAFMKMHNKTLSDSIDLAISEMDRTAKIILGNSNNQEIFARRNLGASDLQMIRDNEALQNNIWSLTSLRDSFHVLIADTKGDFYYKDAAIYSDYSSNIFNDAFIKENQMILDNGDYLLVPSFQTGFSFIQQKPVCILARSLKNLSGDNILSYILVLVDLSAMISRISESLPADLELDAIVTDQDGMVVLSQNLDEIGKIASSENAGYQYYYYDSKTTGWTTRLSNPLQQPVTEANLVFKFLLPLAVVVLAGSVVLAVFLFANILRPINRLVEAMKMVKDGDISIQLEEPAYSSDLDVLYNGFNRMIREIDGLTEAIVQERMSLHHAQMAVLRYQINPHFLFNTLQTMEAIGEVNGIEEIQKIATSLGNMLRYNIRGTSNALLSEELEQVNTYLQIEKIRFKSKLSYTISSNEDTDKCVVPRFILQPIVENCIVHGGKNFTGFLEITVHTHLQENNLIVDVYNSGQVMKQDKFKQIAKNLEGIIDGSFILPQGESIGVFNTHKRIVSRYGADYGIRFLYSDEGRGTCVQINLPNRVENL